MKIGILSDAHGNHIGLRSAIDLLQDRGAERFIFLGDAVNYFGRCAEVLSLLRENNIESVRGNHEEMLLKQTEPAGLERLYNLEHTQSLLRKDDLDYISSWPLKMQLESDGCAFLFVHGSPLDELSGRIYPDSDLSLFAELPYEIIFVGHTHRPFIGEIGSVRIINVGSVGFRRDNGSLLSCALIDTTTRLVEIVEFPFPKDKLNSLKPFHANLNYVLERREGVLNA